MFKTAEEFFCYLIHFLKENDNELYNANADLPDYVWAFIDWFVVMINYKEEMRPYYKYLIWKNVCSYLPIMNLHPREYLPTEPPEQAHDEEDFDFSGMRKFRITA